MKRTIETILNLETGELLEAQHEFRNAKQREDEIFKFRNELQTQFEKEIKTYVCIFCKQSVGIRGRRDKSDYYFAHNYNSDDCIIKTGSTLTEDQIKCIKYNGIKESEEHHQLKNQIAYYLEQDPLINSVETEKVYKDLAISKDWKKPDILAVLPDKKIAFELQLSTTFLSVIVSRAVFYKERGVFLIWVFPSFSLEADLQQFTQKDVYYNNSFNVYVFDKEAAERSAGAGALILKCFFKKFSIENGRIVEHWEQEFTAIHSLIYDNEEVTAYLYDSDREKFSLKKELEKQEKETVVAQEQAAINYKCKAVIEYLRKFYQFNSKPWSPFNETPLDNIKSEAEILTLNQQLKFNGDKAKVITDLLISGERSEFLRFICEQEVIEIDLRKVPVQNGTIFSYLIQLENKWEFHQRIKLLFRSGYKLTDKDFGYFENLYDKYYFNQTESERQAIERWAFISCLNSVWDRSEVYEMVSIIPVLFAILSVKHDMPIKQKFANMRAHAIHFLNHTPQYGILYINAMKYYNRYDQLLTEDKRGKLKDKINEFLSDTPEQENHPLIFQVFPEL